ncbi:hypothetical protein [Sulfuricurvum sp.]|uniref:hypothetical protein n=1 Tax=Sulfuricurvum sp. TaxID=2025608 RepID=UPI002D613CBE|nr:hypothetical protein [Sulfuricurvum sp.]HZF69381.1 hypothetical protein [Sulfuricurvum sp.]
MSEGVKYKVDSWNNFCRVFELPNEFSSEYCFGGGIPTNFQMVDWFCPIMGLGQYTVSKEKCIEMGYIPEEVEVDHLDEANALVEFLKQKNYVKEDKTYLVLTTFGMSFSFKNGVLL